MYTYVHITYHLRLPKMGMNILQENAAGNALDALAKLSQPEVSVMRGGEVVSIPTVPGRRQRWHHLFLVGECRFFVISQR